MQLKYTLNLFCRQLKVSRIEIEIDSVFIEVVFSSAQDESEPQSGENCLQHAYILPNIEFFFFN